MIAWLNRITGRRLCRTGAHHPVPLLDDRRLPGIHNAYCARCKRVMWVAWPTIATAEELASVEATEGV